MPTYTYKCDKCHTVQDKSRQSSMRDYPLQCSCGSVAMRSFVDEMKGTAVDATMKENERMSWSMGVHVDQIPAMMKKYPGSEYCPKTGCLKVNNRQDKVRKMKQRGLTEFA